MSYTLPFMILMLMKTFRVMHNARAYITYKYNYG